MTQLKEHKEDHIIPVMHWESNDVIYNETSPADLVQRKITRNRIEELANKIGESISENVHPVEKGVLTHYHTKGIYARELFIPKETVIVSQLHKLPRLCIILSGDISFTTEYGSQRVKGPYTAVFPPGSRVALFTHEDTVWTAIHGTDETDMDALEDQFIAKDHSEYDAFCASIGIEQGGE